MEKYYYLILNLLIILFPFLLSFDKRVRYFRKWKYVLLSILVVSPVYLVWDYFATRYGHWSFNQSYVTGAKFFGLPIEECLFFITVPFSCLFIYECLKGYIGEKNIRLNFTTKNLAKLTLLFGILGLLFYSRYYTFTLLLFCAVLFLISCKSAFNIFNSTIYWKFILVSFIPFIICNYFLTSLPIVIYSPKAILGGRFLTIPIEDFLYSFSMLSFYLVFYLYFQEKQSK